MPDTLDSAMWPRHQDRKDDIATKGTEITEHTAGSKRRITLETSVCFVAKPSSCASRPPPPRGSPWRHSGVGVDRPNGPLTCRVASGHDVRRLAGHRRILDRLGRGLGGWRLRSFVVSIVWRPVRRLSRRVVGHHHSRSKVKSKKPRLDPTARALDCAAQAEGDDEGRGLRGEPRGHSAVGATVTPPKEKGPDRQAFCLAGPRTRTRPAYDVSYGAKQYRKPLPPVAMRFAWLQPRLACTEFHDPLPPPVLSWWPSWTVPRPSALLV